jgi:hypothetical protein
LGHNNLVRVQRPRPPQEQTSSCERMNPRFKRSRIRALDANTQISAFRKLKLAICALVSDCCGCDAAEKRETVLPITTGACFFSCNQQANKHGVDCTLVVRHGNYLVLCAFEIEAKNAVRRGGPCARPPCHGIWPDGRPQGSPQGRPYERTDPLNFG